MQLTYLKYKTLSLFLLLYVLFTGIGGFCHAGPLSFDLDAPRYREMEAHAIAEQLGKIGIKVNVRILDRAILDKKIRSGQVTACLTDWGSAFFDPFDLAQPKLATDGRGNFSFYSNKRIDELLTVGSSSSGSRKRKEAYHEIQDIIFQDVPWVFGYTLANIEAVSQDVENFRPAMDNRINLHDVRLKKGETFIAGMNTDAFHSLDPAMHRNRETETMLRNMSDALVTRTANGIVVAELAESWVQEDEKNYVFRLRGDVKFHNGDPMTAGDVLFTFQRVLEPERINGRSSPRRELLGPLARVEKTDDRHVRFILDKPFPAFLQALVHFQIVPEKYIRKVGDSAFAGHPIGTGPYQFVSGDLEKKIIMERFPAYYGGSPDLPPVSPARISRVIFKAMPDPMERIRSLLAGELSLVQAVPPHMVNSLSNYNDIRVLSVWGTRSCQMELNNRIPPFDDVRIRRALNHAINWNAILNNIYMGHGKRLATCFLPGGFAYNDALKPHVHDIWEAKRLIREAGYDLKEDTADTVTYPEKEKYTEETGERKPRAPSLLSSLTDKYPKVRIAISPDSAPFHFTDDSGKPSGMFVDFWKLWSEKTGTETEFIRAPWNDTLTMLKEGKADIHAGLFRNSGRDAFLDYAAPLYQAETHYFFHKSIYDINDPEDLLPFRIGIIKGDFAVQYIKKRLPEAVLSVYKDNNSLFDAVENGNIRVFIKDTPIALHHLTRRGILPQFRYNASAPLYSNMFYSAVAEGNKELADMIIKGMDAVSAKERAAIVRKWMGVSDIRTDDVPVVSIADEFMPFSGLSFEGKPVGMLIDIWRLWSEKSGKKIEFRVSDRNDPVYTLSTGDADICSAMPATESHQRKMDYSQPFYRLSSSLFFLKENHPENKAPASRRYGAVHGSHELDYLRMHYPEPEIMIFPDTRTMIRAALENKIDAYFENIPVSLYYLEKLDPGGKFTQMQDITLRENIHAGVKKGNADLLALVDTGFNAITQKELSEIEKQWIRDPEIRQLQKKDSLQIRLTAAERDWLEKHKDIRLGIDPAWPPFDYLGEDGSHMGMASDYVRLLNQRLGLDMKIVPNLDWSEVVRRIREKSLDVIPCISETPQRRSYLNFTDPYISFPLVILVRKDSPLISDLNDLTGKTVAVVRDYVTHQRLESDHPDIRLFLARTPAEGLEALYTGKADAYVGNLAVCSFLIQKLHIANLKVAAPAKPGEDYEHLRFGVRRDWPELVSILNKGLATISPQERREIQQKWFAVRFEYGISTGYVRSLLLKSGTAAAVIIIVILLWNRGLKREIAERRKAEAALVHAKNQADAANRAKSVFLANMSHEIRTPMNAILGFSQIMLRDQSLRADHKENLRTIWRSGEHLLGLINDILTMSKIESGRETLNEDSFDLYGILEDMEMMFRVRTDGAGLAFRVEKGEGLPRYVKTDEGKLRQILINLLGNAVKFTEKGGIVLRVRSEKKADDASAVFLFFEVEDSGAGISQEEQGKLFQYFEQTTSGRNSEGGTGLGLAISAAYVRLMGGDISVSTREDAGSVFCFHIAVQQGEVRNSKSADLPGYVVGIEKGQPEIRVLVADDRKTNRDVLVKMLSALGFQVREAVNGKEAVTIFENWFPHVVLMDMIMPVMDGFEGTRIIKSMAAGKDTVIFAVSASVLEHEEKTIMEYGAAEFVRKPFREDELLELIRQHTGIVYVYQDADETGDRETEGDIPFSAAGESLDALPRELREEMYYAVINGYGKKIQECIEVAGKYDRQAAKVLSGLADQYEYERLADMLRADS